jgi:dephospho-CoA kinase
MNRLIIGLTGGICSGKSTVSAEIAARGVRVADCDEISHYLTAYDPKILNAIAQRFGSGVFHQSGALDRGALARVVFADEDERRALEQILHPPIIDVLKCNIDWARQAVKPLLVVAPLLIEAGLLSLVDKVWVVACSRENQVKRLMERGGKSSAEAEKWIDAQLALEEKKKLADTVIDNDGTIDELKETIRREWQALGLG